ncbi:MAG: hypothetical protein ACM3TR_11175 [Caulobacteraceae bacterium]
MGCTCNSGIKDVLPLREQYNMTDGWLLFRLKNVLPRIMKREAIDMWIVIAREYNEDPVFITLIPALARTASRMSCLVFYVDGAGELECLSLCRPNGLLERFYKRSWDGKTETAL